MFIRYFYILNISLIELADNELTILIRIFLTEEIYVMRVLSVLIEISEYELLTLKGLVHSAKHRECIFIYDS